MRKFLVSLAVTGTLLSGAAALAPAASASAPVSADLWQLLQGYYYGASSDEALAACDAAGAAYVEEHASGGAVGWLCRSAGPTSYALYILSEA